jgi:hypothetical protein
MRDNSNWTLRFNRTSKEAIGRDLRPEDFESEGSELFLHRNLVNRWRCFRGDFFLKNGQHGQLNL